MDEERGMWTLWVAALARGQAVDAPPVVTWRSDPPGAEVWAGPELLGTTPFVTPMPATRLLVEFRSAGLAPVTREVRPASGPVDVAVVLAPPDAGTLTVVLAGVGWAELSIDGTRVGTAPVRARPLAAGTHEVRVAQPLVGLDETRVVVIGPREGASVVFTVP